MAPRDDGERTRAQQDGRVSKQSYTVPCATSFRDALLTLAARRGVNVGDIARSVMLVMPESVVRNAPDPGGPARADREAVVLKSGPSAGRPWRRKPRLQVRMTPGLDIPFIRKALGLALELDRGGLVLRLGPASGRGDAEAAVRTREAGLKEHLRRQEEEIERLQTLVSVLSFDPLPHGVLRRADALHVLGFPPDARPDSRMIRARFRMLATIHHPDSPYGDHARMSQINAAMEILRRKPE